MKASVLSICVCVLLAFSARCYAWSEEIKCHSGNCDQWKASYERTGDTVLFEFDNVSGKPLFKIKATIQYYDYFGEYLGQNFVKLEGPIHKYFKPKFQVPSKVSRIEYDINCTEEYEGTAPAVAAAE